MEFRRVLFRSRARRIKLAARPYRLSVVPQEKRAMPSNEDDFETLSPDSDKAGAPPKKTGPSLKARAIGYLSRREHSRHELSRKLAPFTDDPQEIESLLTQLERENWLSNERFAQRHRKSTSLNSSH